MTSLIVVAPVEVLAFGVILGQLSANYHQPDLGVRLLPALLSVIVIWPVVTALQVPMITTIVRGRTPSMGSCLRAGLRKVPEIALAGALAVIGVYLGLLFLVVPGIYLAFSWYFVPQMVVLENYRGISALAQSWQLVKGSWARVLGTGGFFWLIAAVPQILLWAASLRGNGGGLVVLAIIVANSISVSLTAVGSTILYLDLGSPKSLTAGREAWSLAQ
jgi:hypothetical protein